MMNKVFKCIVYSITGILVIGMVILISILIYSAIIQAIDLI